MIPVGKITGPSGKIRVTTTCPNCSEPTTELWPCVTGLVGCPRCVDNDADAFFACVQEYAEDGSDFETHLLPAKKPA